MPDVPAASRALPRILIVEAHDDMRRMQVRFLSRTFAVDFATTGEEALEMALGRPYTAIVLDVYLQGRLSGVEVMQGLKATPQHRKTAMIATSGPLSQPERDALIRAGFDFYLAKPFRWQVLLDVVRHAVAQSLGQPEPSATTAPRAAPPSEPPVASVAPEPVAKPSPPVAPSPVAPPVAPPAVEPSAVDPKPVEPVPVEPPVETAATNPSLARLVDQLSRDVTPPATAPSATAPAVAPPTTEPRSPYAPPEKPEASLFREALAASGVRSSPPLPDRTGWTSLGDL